MVSLRFESMIKNHSTKGIKDFTCKKIFVFLEVPAVFLLQKIPLPIPSLWPRL